MCSAVRYIHSRGIIHRDIKPEILIVKDSFDRKNLQIKLVDFGFCLIETKTSSSQSNLLYGTAG